VRTCLIFAPLQSDPSKALATRVASSRGVRLPPLHRRGTERPLLLRSELLRARPSASVGRPPGLSIPFRPRGFAPPRRFTPLGACGLVASRCRSWGSSRFSRFRGRQGPFGLRRTRERSSRRGSHPSKDTSRSQPCRVTAVVASVPFRRLRGVAPQPSWQPDAHPCEHAQPPSFLGFVPLQGPSTRDRETLPDRDADRRRTVCRGSAPHPHLAVNRAAGHHTSRCSAGGRPPRPPAPKRCGAGLWGKADSRGAGPMDATGRRNGRHAHLLVEPRPKPLHARSHRFGAAAPPGDPRADGGTKR